MKTSPLLIATTAVILLALAGCTPEVGSKAWCELMKKKPEGDWTLNEATEYAKSCIFRLSDK